jgi:3-dehydroquinate dehydratase/shikimate dehydrogenase
MFIKTKRLLLRAWKDNDIESFAAMNADKKVMEYFPKVLTREESYSLFKKISTHIQKMGWGFWAVEVPGISNFIGFIGLSPVSFTAHFTPAVEIGWRLGLAYWGKGYATEGALASLEYGFKKLHLPEIVSFTAKQNAKSIAVMKRIGMHHNPSDDFNHPKLMKGNPLLRHVLYRFSKKEWEASR